MKVINIWSSSQEQSLDFLRSEKIPRLPLAHARVPPFIKLNTYKLYYRNYIYTY